MTPDEAKITIVHHLIDCLLTHHDVQWEDWPDIGEGDWEDISHAIRVEGRRHEMPRERVDEAYRLLAERAKR